MRRLSLLGSIALLLLLVVLGWWAWPTIRSLLWPPSTVLAVIQLEQGALDRASDVRETHSATLIETFGQGWQIWRLPGTAVSALGADPAIAFQETSTPDVAPAIPIQSIPLDALSTTDREKVRDATTFPTVVGFRVSLGRPSGLTADIVERGLQSNLPLAFELTDGTQISLQREDLVYRGLRDFTWIGSAPDGSSRATLTMTLDGILGTVSVGGMHYSITPLSNGSHLIQRLDVARMPPMHADAASSVAVSRVPIARTMLPSCDSKPTNQVNVLILFGRDTESEVAKGVADNLVDGLNSSLKRRGLQTAIKASVVVMNVPDGTTVKDDFDLLSPPKRETVIRYRRQTESDFVVHLTNGLQNSCGNVPEIGARLETAYAVVSKRCVVNHATVFHHEIGHLLGLRHQRDVDPVDDPFRHGHAIVRRTPVVECSIMTGEAVCYGDDWSSPTTKGASGAVLYDADYSYEVDAIRQATPAKARLWCSPREDSPLVPAGRHIVKVGQSLSVIAQLYYNRQLWRPIYSANTRLIANPNLIQPGWLLSIPERAGSPVRSQ